MSGGKGGSTTSSVTIPEYIEAAAQRNLNKAERISQIGYTPYYGPDVAAFTPMQEAAFQNTADTAGAFGMAAPSSQQDIMGGMAPPTEYAGGVRGYSSAPMYEQSLETLAENRPGQKSYIDSFFIDPYTGQPGSNAPPQIDYTQYGTMADQTAAQQANDLAIAQAGAGPQNVNYNVSSTPDYNYGGETYTGGDYANSQITNPAGGTGMGSITDTSAPGTFEGIGNDISEGLTGFAANTLPGKFLLGPSYNVGGANNPIETPTINEMVTNSPGGMEYNPTTGGYSGGDSGNVYTDPSSGGAFSGGGSDGVGNFGAVGDFFGGIGDSIGVTDYANQTPTPATAPVYASQTPPSGTAPVRPLASPNRTDSSNSGNTSDTGDSGGCVVATHAVNSGAFSPTTKREAVVWCMNVLHGKWWGEAIRRGYRHLGRSKIEQGKAAEHYQEFRNYIAFATGKKRTFKGALHFAARTVQFLAVGLVKKDV
jgi:hypothetical protein|tara:strand:+ start:17 stop:1456 length:1440 start_codon:yes stop_codon:yes gene_type:complete